MKNKIIGIFVCMLLIATAIPGTGTFLTLMPNASATNANMKPIIGNGDANMENYTLPCWGRYLDTIFCKYGGLSSIQAVDLADEIGLPTGYTINRWNYSSSSWDTYIVGISTSFMIYPDEILIYYGADTLPSCGSCISPNATLYVWIEDPQSYLMDVYFYNTEDWTLIGQNLSVSNGSYSQLTTCFSLYDTWYNWSVNVTNSAGLWTNKTIKIKTMEEPPSPPIIDGPSEGKVGCTYNYTFNATDPDGDNVFYYIDWGDGSAEDWFGPFESGEEVTVNHTWSETGNYIIRAKARNIFGRESEWGYLEVTVAKFTGHGVPYGTHITMSMGGPVTTKPVEAIQVGEFISSYDPINQIVTTAEVMEVCVYTENLPERLIFNSNLEVTLRQTLFINETEWMNAVDAREGIDFLLENLPGTPITIPILIFSKEQSTGPAYPIYDLVIRPLQGEASGYWANGILVGGFTK